MANFRKTTKYGSRTVTQGTGGTTTSYSSGSTMKDGRGTRRTVTTKSNGQRYIRTTEGAGGGYYKTTQKSLNPTRSRGLKRSSSGDPFKLTKRDFDKLAGERDGSGTIYIIVFFFGLWAFAQFLLWVQNLLMPIFNYIGTSNTFNIVTTLIVCVASILFMIRFTVNLYKKIVWRETNEN